MINKILHISQINFSLAFTLPRSNNQLTDLSAIHSFSHEPLEFAVKSRQSLPP